MMTGKSLIFHFYPKGFRQNDYPSASAIAFAMTYSLDSDLSGG